MHINNQSFQHKSSTNYLYPHQEQKAKKTVLILGFCPSMVTDSMFDLLDILKWPTKQKGYESFPASLKKKCITAQSYAYTIHTKMCAQENVSS